jgi:ribosomal protein L44E
VPNLLRLLKREQGFEAIKFIESHRSACDIIDPGRTDRKKAKYGGTALISHDNAPKPSFKLKHLRRFCLHCRYMATMNDRGLPVRTKDAESTTLWLRQETHTPDPSCFPDLSDLNQSDPQGLKKNCEPSAHFRGFSFFFGAYIGLTLI